jgi:hypothetical protein
MQDDVVLYRSRGIFNVLALVGCASIGVAMLVAGPDRPDLGAEIGALFFFGWAALLVIMLWTGCRRISVRSANGDVVLVLHRIGRDELLPLRAISAIDYYKDSETSRFEIHLKGRKPLSFGSPSRKECRLMLMLLELNPAIIVTGGAQDKLARIRAVPGR